MLPRGPRQNSSKSVVRNRANQARGRRSVRLRG